MKKHFWFGCVPAALHLIFVACLYYAFVHDGNSSATYGWMLLLFIDYPVSLGMGIDQLQIKGNTIWNNGTLPGLYFGILGTIWWFLLGYTISRLSGAIGDLIKRKRTMAPPAPGGDQTH